MFKQLVRVLFCLLLLTLTGQASNRSPALTTRDEVDAFMVTYYDRPQPDLIARLIDALGSTGFVQKTAHPYVIGFFSEVFAANPDRVPSWGVSIAKQDAETKGALDQALALSKAGGIESIDDHSAEMNDAYWGAFFASGNPKFIKKLINQLKYFDERDDLKLFGAGGTAKWSLASNAQSHPAIRIAIEEAKHTADKRTQDIIDELLAEDPEHIKQELKEIVAKQQEMGKWKGPIPGPVSDAEHEHDMVLNEPKTGFKRPVPIFSPNPEYTPRARKAKEQGSVRLQAFVTPQGTVTNVQVMKGLSPDLDEKAVATVQTWKFEPGTRNGTPVGVRITVDVNFNLVKDEPK